MSHVAVVPSAKVRVMGSDGEIWVYECKRFPRLTTVLGIWFARTLRKWARWNK